MLSIVTGPFHPDLEHALVAEVHSHKRDDPLRPLAIVVPSQQFARRVKWLLSVGQGRALLELHVLTFHQLAMTVLREAGGEALPALVNGSFREELLRYLVDRGVPGAEAFRERREMRGLWTGLWATVQDLKEARVDPSAVLQAVDEGRLRTEDPARLAALVRLYAAVCEVDRALHLADPDDLAALAMERVADSVYLKRMARVCYYGLYDLTQGQLDFFKAVAGAYPTTLFFPLRPASPAYRFAQRFFETYVQGLAGTGKPLTLSLSPQAGRGEGEGTLADEMAVEVRGACHIVSAVGVEDEVAAAAKEILRLIEDRDCDPLEIGVVARTLDPYLPTLRRIFDDNRIPFACPVGEPLIHEPLVKTIIRFLRLRVEAFPRAAVIDVLTSPAFRIASILAGGGPADAPPTPTGAPPSLVPRPDLWDWATRRLGIVRGNPEDGSLGDWLRLERAAKMGLAVLPDDDAEQPRPAIAAEQVALLFDLVARLHRALSALPDTAGWDGYTEAFLRLLPGYFHLPAWQTGAADAHADRVQTAIKACLESVASLEQLSEDISLADWVEHVVRVLERARVPSAVGDRHGVQVLDAMDARGLPFRALFVLGLNEKVFPRSVQEDPFLRDADRAVLARDLGFKIPCKLEGFDEERLLFALLLRAARERIVLSYQRADRDGRAMVPSGYLAELKPHVGESEVRVTRRPTQRWTEWPFAQRPSDKVGAVALLTPREAGLLIILQGGASSSLTSVLRLHQPPELFAQGLAAVAALDSMKPALTPHDGMVGVGRAHWRMLERHGVSPTALERYAQCPFKYFAEKVLRLEPLETPDSVLVPDARARGTLCHAILRRFYQQLTERQVALDRVTSSDIGAWLAAAAEAAFTQFEATEPVGYPLLWSLVKEDLTRLVRTFIENDLQELRASGYRPILFEVAVTGAFGATLPDTERHVPIRGRLDRVDLRRDNGQAHVRIVDYKYTESRGPKLEDRDLATAALRGKRLQPPLYLLAATGVFKEEPAVADEAAFYFLAPYWPNGPVVRTGLAAFCGEGTVRVILEGVRHGRFFILPGEYCDYCEFSSACRRTHHPTKWRQRDNAEKRILEDLRQQKA
jgi:ATP-dependent helicase/nuclease subunit B